ncbi:MAG: protein kinase [Planctomycetota bacterium]
MATDALLNSTVGGCLILDIIGQGGMGVIYKARQKSLDRIVALKVLTPHLAMDINFVTRFQREARAIARVNHQNILAVYDVGDDQNVNYMIMELIDGQSLAELQNERNDALTWELAANFIRQAAQGLEAAQLAGIIHRDIKPENLMVTKKGVIKVSDFGLAKEADTINTSTDAVMGTPAFMSPEQCDGKKVDGRSDIYSLGGTFYRLITGRLPFEAETAMSMMYRHKHEALIPPHEVNSCVPQDISAVIVKMMQKKREHRYQTMTEVIHAIDTIDDTLKLPPASLTGMRLAGIMMTPPLDAPELASPNNERNAATTGREADDTNILRRRDPSASIPLRPMASGNRLVAGPHTGFKPSSNSSSRLNMPSGIAVPNDAYVNVSRGDEQIASGDRLTGIKHYYLALQSDTLDAATRKRVKAELWKEVEARRTVVQNLAQKGQLVEASRECRVLTELDPTDKISQAILNDIEAKLTAKRTLINDIRTAIASGDFDRAIEIWDSLPLELHDDPLAKQIDQLRNVVIPSFNLAEQGEKFNKQGRLEDAVSSFKDALKINQMCEPARHGLKDSEQKLQRIDYLLKEGHQYSLEQNYSKAVELWRSILQLRPGHPQAIKNIMDAYVTQAQNLRDHGDIEGAWLAYKNATDIDPQNRSARNAFEELTNLRDKENALVDRAHEAVARNRMSLAIRNWKEVQRINPTNKQAAQHLVQLRKQRRSSITKVLAILIVLGAFGVGVNTWYRELKILENPRRALEAIDETTTLADMRNEIKQSGALEMVKALEEAKILICKSARDEALNGLRLWLRIDCALGKQESGQYVEAEKDLRALSKELVKKNQPLSLILHVEELYCKAQDLLAEATAAVTDAKWEKALQYFSEIKFLLLDAGPALAAKTLDAEIEKKALVMQRLVNAERFEKAGRKSDAFREYQAAKKLITDLKMASMDEYLIRSLARVDYDENKFDKVFESGKSALKRSPPDLNASRAAFREAWSINHRDDVKAYLQFTIDTMACDAEGMALYARLHPLRHGDGEGKYERTQSSVFCIDRYEFPNQAGQTPCANITWLEANDACRKVGKTLCKSTRWSDACRGGANFTTQYPYGNIVNSGESNAWCNTDGTNVKPSGSMPKCRNTIGVYDMSGNLAEWTDESDPNNATVIGGAYDSPASITTCDSMQPQLKTTKALQIGFRCCKDLATPETLKTNP